MIFQGKKAVDRLFSSEIDDKGDRACSSLHQAIVSVLEEIFNMPLDKRVHIGFDIPDENSVIKDLSNAAKAVFNRKVSRDASRHVSKHAKN